MAREDYTCAHRLRVRWAEVDMQGIVFNGHYLTYIDTAIAEYWRATGLPYPHGYVERYGNDMYLRKAELDYLGSAHYDDELDVLCRAARLGRTSISFRFEIHRAGTAPSGKPLITAELVYVNADPKTMTPAPLPAALRELIGRYERTSPEGLP